MYQKQDDWKEGLSEDEIIDGFIDFFNHDLEKWFSRDVCCCDRCVSDIEGLWPGVHVFSDEFERNSIELNTFYSGSYLQDVFTKDEFDKYIQNIYCPNCLRPLNHDTIIYPFEFEFEVAEYEKIIADVFKIIDSDVDLKTTEIGKKLYNEILK